MVSGNPAELRKVAQKARQVASSLDSEFKVLESQYSALRYAVPNKGKVDELLPAGRRKIREAIEQLTMLEQFLNRIAQGLENVNKAL